MIVDVSTFVGPYPFRAIPDCSADGLVRSMDRVGIDRAWVGHLPSAFLNDPAPGIRELARAIGPHAARLVAVPTVDPNLPRWRDDLRRAAEAGAPAVRAYPMHHGAQRLPDLVAEASGAGLALVLTVRFEDGRQRHPLDVTTELPAAVIRQAARANSQARIVVTHGGRDLVEEVHYSLTDAEAARVRWEISWIWGPPFDDLRHLVSTVGAEFFVFGTGMPLRIPENTFAKLELSDLDSAQVAAVHADNLDRWLAGST